MRIRGLFSSLIKKHNYVEAVLGLVFRTYDKINPNIQTRVGVSVLEGAFSIRGKTLYYILVYYVI